MMMKMIMINDEYQIIPIISCNAESLRASVWSNPLQIYTPKLKLLSCLRNVVLNSKHQKNQLCIVNTCSRISTNGLINSSNEASDVKRTGR